MERGVNVDTSSQIGSFVEMWMMSVYDTGLLTLTSVFIHNVNVCKDCQGVVMHGDAY